MTTATEFGKFIHRFEESLFSGSPDDIFDFECDADEFFHAYLVMIHYMPTHTELVRQVADFAGAREGFKSSMPDVYACAEKKFLNDWQEHAVAIGKRPADKPLPDIDDVFNNAIKTAEQYFADAENAEATA
jgi:hypothetical protein